MSSDPNALRSRRALLAAAAGSAAAVAASAALPLSVAAAPVNMQTETNNATVAQTSITLTDATPLTPEAAFMSVNTSTAAAAIIAGGGNLAGIAPDTSLTGAYGFSESGDGVTTLGAGLWGDSDVGVVGTGGAGVLGIGTDGVVGIGDVGGTGVTAISGGTVDLALDVQGKVRFSRSGRGTIGSGRSSLKVTLAGVTSGSRVFAVLHSNRSGRYVRAVVPTTNSFTVYLNTTVTSATYVAWFVLN
jgi:hypothetical protein